MVLPVDLVRNFHFAPYRYTVFMLDCQEALTKEDIFQFHYDCSLYVLALNGHFEMNTIFMACQAIDPGG